MEPVQGTTPGGNPLKPYKNPPHAKFADNLAMQRFLIKKSEQRNLVYLIIIAICVVCTVLIATTFNYKTYVVRVDNATGRVEVGGQLKATNYSPREAEIQHFLVQFLTNVRSVPLDPVMFKQNWNDAGYFMTENAEKKLVAFTQGDNPAKKLGKVTVQPKISSIQQYPGVKNTYQIRWVEQEYSMDGSMSNRMTQYSGLFLIEIDPPTKEKDILINPLGLKIADLTITAEQTNVNKEVQ